MEATYRYSLFTILTTVLANFRLPGEVRFVEGTRRCPHARGRGHRRPDGAVRRALVQPDARPPEKRTIRTRTRERPRDEGGSAGRAAANPGDAGARAGRDPAPRPGPPRRTACWRRRGRGGAASRPRRAGAWGPHAGGPRPLGSRGAARSPSSQRADTPRALPPPPRGAPGRLSPSVRTRRAGFAAAPLVCP